jgi:Zn-dependent protease with chaperone function
MTEADLNETVRALAGKAGLTAPPVRVTKPRNRSLGEDNAQMVRRRGMIRLDIEPTVLALPPWRIEALVAHELGHQEQPRLVVEYLPSWINQFILTVAFIGVFALTDLLAVVLTGRRATTAVAVGWALVINVVVVNNSRHSRRDETAADLFAARLVGANRVIEHLLAWETSRPDRIPSLRLGRWLHRIFSTHPSHADRVAAVKAARPTDGR